MKKQIANWGNYPVIESNEEYFLFRNSFMEFFQEKSALFPAVMVVVMEMHHWLKIPFPH